MEYKDISELKTFEKYGDVFTQVRNTPDTGWWLYRRVNKEDPTKIHYEVVKGHMRKLPENKVIYVYPSTSEWGIYGYTVPNNKYADRIIDFIVGAKIRTAEELHNFKLSL